MFTAYRFAQNSADPMAALESIRSLNLEGTVSALSGVTNSDDDTSIMWVVVKGPRALAQEELEMVDYGFSEGYLVTVPGEHADATNFTEADLADVIQRIRNS